MTTLDPSNPYAAYTYAYPHKTAYRRLEPLLPLQGIWAEENKSNLFLYLHIPFCEMRCGFCNLFTTVNPGETLEQRYLDALERQARMVQEALGDARFVRMAIGGGTPTYLQAADLHRLFDIAEIFGVELNTIPISVETSPATVTSERLEALRLRYVKRISMGVQSFIEDELKSLGRPQKNAKVFEALENIKAAEFPLLNLDLIYGMAGQTVESWLESLETAVSFEPQELFIYPLYVRPLTGLGKQGRGWNNQRLELYRVARDFLTSHGYKQFSMRVFKKTRNMEEGLATLHYDSQRDGMVGLGCGARSYTRRVHYSSEYAVGQGGVKAIIQDYIRQEDSSFALAHYRFKLSEAEQGRRFVLGGLLNVQGLDTIAYRRTFGTDVLDELPQLKLLLELGLAKIEGDCLRLSEGGLELSDAIGPWLYSAEVQNLSAAYELR